MLEERINRLKMKEQVEHFVPILTEEDIDQRTDKKMINILNQTKNSRNENCD